MQIFIQSLFLFSALILVGCGGGGGRYYPMATPINNIDLEKVPLGENEYTAVYFPVSYDELMHKRYDSILKQAEQLWGKSSYFVEAQFAGRKYYIEANGNVNMRDEAFNIIKTLRLPRYTYVCASFSIRLVDVDYLVIYVDQQPTSHSSTLLLLNHDLEIVYQDHLLGAIGLGYGNSPEFGNYIALKSEDFWYPYGDDGKERVRVDLNGDWLYYLKDVPQD
jgi:hypothetical protein